MSVVSSLCCCVRIRFHTLWKQHKIKVEDQDLVAWGHFYIIIYRPSYCKYLVLFLTFYLSPLRVPVSMLAQCDPPCRRPQLWVLPWQRGQQREWMCGTWAPVTFHMLPRRSMNLRSILMVRTHTVTLLPPSGQYFILQLELVSVLITESEFRFARWKKAVQKAMNWETTEPCCNSNGTNSCSHLRNIWLNHQMDLDCFRIKPSDDRYTPRVIYCTKLFSSLLF